MLGWQVRQLQFRMPQCVEACDACNYVAELLTKGDDAKPHERLSRVTQRQTIRKGPTMKRLGLASAVVPSNVPDA